MSFHSPNTPEKPYNRCIDCEHIGQNCDGPDFLAMSIDRLCEWSRLRKDFLHKQDHKWTNAYIAQQADMSVTTVNRFFSGDMEDIKFTTAARILRVLVNGTWGQYPCSMAAGVENSNELQFKCDELNEQLNAEQAKTEYLRNQVTFTESTIKEQRMLLRSIRKESVVLSIALGICIVVIIAALLVDLLNPEIGFFWVNQ